MRGMYSGRSMTLHEHVECYAAKVLLLMAHDSGHKIPYCYKSERLNLCKFYDLECSENCDRRVPC